MKLEMIDNFISLAFQKGEIMKEYTVEIFAESYNSYIVKANNSERAVMEAMSSFLNENDTESMITIKSVTNDDTENEDEE